MLKINNKHYTSINEASKATGLSRNDLTRRYFTTGKGIVKGHYIEFDDAQEVDINKWITDNYKTLVTTVTKYYGWNEDVFQDMIIYLINSVKEGKVKNYEQAFYNRYRGSILDIKRKNAKNRKMAADQSNIIPISANEGEDTYEPVKTKWIMESETFMIDDTGEERSNLDMVEHSLWDNGEAEQDIEGINYLVKLHCTKQILAEYLPVNHINFVFDVLSKDNKQTIASIAKKYGVSVKLTQSLIQAVTNKCEEPEVNERIHILYENSKYNTFDDLTLKAILS